MRVLKRLKKRRKKCARTPIYTYYLIDPALSCDFQVLLFENGVIFIFYYNGTFYLE